MNNQSNQLPIYDIKTIVSIPDYSIYFYYCSIVVAIFLFGLLLYFMIQRYRKFRKENKEKIYFDILKNIDFEDQKKAAYTISRYGSLLAKDERQKRLFEELYHKLEEFKYRKKIEKKIPKTLQLQYETFLESLDVA